MNGGRGTFCGHWRLIGALFAALLATGMVVAVYAQSQDTTITMVDSKTETVTPEWTGATFPGVADVDFMGYCPPGNYTTTCYVTVSVSFSIAPPPGPQPSTDLYTKSITIASNTFTQLAVTFNGGNALRVLYGEDTSGHEVATIYTPFVSTGSTWTFEYIVLDAPIVDGHPTLGMNLDVQIGNTAIFGHSYDLQAPIQLSTNSTLG